jgi:hypothetical protein
MIRRTPFGVRRFFCQKQRRVGRNDAQTRRQSETLSAPVYGSARGRRFSRSRIPSRASTRNSLKVFNCSGVRIWRI